MARPFRFVHAADVHLDTPYRSHDPVLRARLLDAGRLAFTRLVDLCLGESVDALLLAGDVFDNERLRFATEAVLVEQVGRLTDAGIEVVMVTGNHDPGRGNYRAHGLAWPARRFTLVRSHAVRTVDVRDGSGALVGCVVGAGHQTASDGANLAARVRRPDDRADVPCVGLLHTRVASVLAEDAHAPYAPCTRDDLRAAGVDYWALGHIHERQAVLDDPPAHYPGNLQGRHFGEPGARGALLVELERGAPARVAFRPLAPVRWETLAVDGLADVVDLSALSRRVRAAFDALREGDASVLPDQRWMLRVELLGPCPLAGECRDDEDRAELQQALARALGVLGLELRTERLHAPIDLDAYRGQPHVLAIALQVAAELREDPLALEALAPDALAGLSGDDPVARRRYLRGLLDGIEPDLAEALLRPGAPLRAEPSLRTAAQPQPEARLRPEAPLRSDALPGEPSA